jgi:protein phosphatase PTC1
VANVGDSRVVLCRDGVAKRLTIDHRPNDIDEIRRVKDAGGTIVNNRVNAILAITRAIGDVYLHPMVTSDPYTCYVDLHYEHDKFLIIACDGVWDVLTDQEAVDHIKDVTDPRVASQNLRDLAYSKNSTDNISVIVVRITNVIN